MMPVHTVDEVFEGIQKAKANATSFRMNLFPSQSKLSAWIAHGELLGIAREGVTFFLRNNRDYWQLFFCAANPAALQREAVAVPELRTERVVTDLVGTESAIGELLAILRGIGFRPYAKLQRLSRGRWSETASAGDLQVIYAGEADAPALLKVIEDSFDHYAEQIPKLYELETAIQQRQIQVVKSGENIAGLLFFETQGVSSTVRFWAVDENFRSLRVGSALMANYLKAHAGVQRFTLWVNSENQNAIQKYAHYGYTSDGYIDHILANEMIPA